MTHLTNTETLLHTDKNNIIIIFIHFVFTLHQLPSKLRHHKDSHPYCGIFGHSFIKRLCRRWNYRSLHTKLPYCGEAHGTAGLKTYQLLNILRRSKLAKFDIVFIQIWENDVLDMNNHQLMHALIDIYNEFRRQGVRHIVFGTMFHRHDRR